MIRRAAIPLFKQATATTARIDTYNAASSSVLRCVSSSAKVAKSAVSTTDPGYSTNEASERQSPPSKDAAPSRESDPFPLPGDPRLEGLSLSSKHQLENLTQDQNFSSRVPGRDPGQESRETKIARLKYQIRHRGILETDLLLSTFAKAHLETLSDAELDEFDQLLDEPDWDIFYWMTERKEVPERWKETFETRDRLGWRLRIHTKNENKETRSMPAL